MFGKLLYRAELEKINSLAASTRANIDTHIRTFLFFCFFLNLSPFPVSIPVLSAYTQYLAAHMKAPGTVKNYIYGLQTVSQLKQWSFPALSDSGFKMQFKGIARSLSHAPKRATPLCPPTLLELSKYFNFESSYESSMWAVVVFGFYMFARLSNLLPPKKGVFDPKKQLTKNDVKIAQDAVVVEIKWSKVIQLGQRVVTLPLMAIPQSPLCPKQAIIRASRLSKSKNSHHLFAFSSVNGIENICQSEFISFIRKKLNKAGLNGSMYSGHSMRRGGQLGPSVKECLLNL